MHERQINPMGRPDGGTNLLGAIVTRLGIVAIVVVGVLIAPSGLPDLSLLNPAGSPSPSRSTTVTPDADRLQRPMVRRALDPASVSQTAPAVWLQENTVSPVMNIGPDATSTVESSDDGTLRRVASRVIGRKPPRTVFHRLCLGLKDGLERLGGYVLARGFPPPSGHRIPANFMPSRS